MATKRISTISEESTINDDVTISSVSLVSPVSPRRSVSFHHPSLSPIPTIRQSTASGPRPAAEYSDITLSWPPGKVKHYSARTHRAFIAGELGPIILGNFVLIAGLCGCLYGFSTISDLNVNNGLFKNVFNFLLILLTVFISLGLGSLLNKIGSMIRWPLLARRPHRVDDVEDILQLVSLSSTCSLAFRHLRTRMISHTTLIFMAFVSVSVVTRLSVSFFGFAFSINEKPFFIQQPELNTTFWPTAPQIPTARLDSDSPKNVYDNTDGLYSFALAGLKQWASNTTDTLLESPDLENLQLDTMAMHSSKNPSKVTYTYSLRNFESSVSKSLISSDRTVNASVACEDWKFLSGMSKNATFAHPDNHKEIINVTEFLYAETGIQKNEYINSLRLVQQQNMNTKDNKIYSPCGQRCSVIWVFYQQSLLDRHYPSLLRCDMTLGNVTATTDQSLTYMNQHNLTIPNHRAQLLTSLLTYQSFIFLKNSYLALPFHIKNTAVSRIFTYERWETDITTNNSASPLFGFAKFGAVDVRNNSHLRSGNYTREDLELWLAGLLARSTAATVAFLDTSGIMPTVTLEPGSTSQGSRSRLQVSWKRVVAICGVLTYLQLAAAALALWYTHGVVVNHQGTFALEHLWKNRGVDTRKEEARDAETNTEVGLVYGTVLRDDVHRLAIGRRDVVKTVFPEGWYL